MNTALLLALTLSAVQTAQEQDQVGDLRPNLVIVLTDDQGWGDLSCQGHPVLATPALDRLAREGQRWTQFYSAGTVCTPSRAALLTGREAVRSGMASSTNVVAFPDSKGGLPHVEVTLAELLSSAGYATHCVGKWHLGHLPPFLPTRHGFDGWYGIPYSNSFGGGPDTDPHVSQPSDKYDLPLMRATRGEEGGEDDVQEVERPVAQETMTRRFTREALTFVSEEREGPFFLYLAHVMPHVPLYGTEEFAGTSRAGLYGDVMAELDAGIGELVDGLRALERPTVVLFASDNGPWLAYNERGGSAGPMRGGKGSTWEGGLRVPCIWWAPGSVEPGIVRELGSLLDVLPTFCALAGVALPEGRTLDGFDLGSVLRDSRAAGPRPHVFYYSGETLCAVREGPWKLHLALAPNMHQIQPLESPALVHLEHDAGETRDLAGRETRIVARLQRLASEHTESIAPVINQLDRRE